MRADAAQLERAFANLVENAARYGAGKPVSVRARAVGRRLLVRIVDQGPGIPSSEQERIFAPFYRVAAPLGDDQRLGPRPGDRARASSRPTAAGSRSSRCPARAQASSSRSRSRQATANRSPATDGGGRAVSRRRPRAGLRRRPADRACAEGHLARRRLRGDHQRERRGGARPRRRAPARRRRSSTSCCPASTASRSAAGCASGPTCRSSCCRRSTRRRRRSARCRPAPTTTSPSRSRQVSSSRGCRPCCGGVAPPDEPVLRAGDIAMDLAAHQVTVDGVEIHLTPIEYELLRMLMRNRGRLLTHRALLTEVWGPEYARRHGPAAHAYRQPARQDRGPRPGAQRDPYRLGVGYRSRLDEILTTWSVDPHASLTSAVRMMTPWTSSPSSCSSRSSHRCVGLVELLDRV